MPRVTSSQHYDRYQLLHHLWNSCDKFYALLPPHCQWQVHTFYQPSKDLAKDELVAHIKELSKTRPSLVYQVGKHVRLLVDVYQHFIDSGIPKSEWPAVLTPIIQHVNPSPEIITKDGRHLSVAAVVRPEIDIELLERVSRMIMDGSGEADNKT